MARLLPLAFLLVLSTCCTASPSRRPFQSIKAVREIIENYEEVLPEISYEDNALPFPTKMSIKVPTQTSTYTLSLSKNQVVMPPHFTSVYYNEHGREVLDKSVHVNCYYQGEVKGHPDWTAVFSTCHGLQGQFGRMDDPESYFHLEPINQDDPSMEQMHAFYLDSEYKIRDGVCGSGDSHGHIGDMVHMAREILNSTDARRVRQQNTERFVELVLVNDHRQFESNGNDLSATVMRSLSIANSIDDIYRALDIRITLTHTITFTSSDMFTVQPDPEPLLDAFTAFVQTSNSVTSITYDSIMLITGIDLAGSTVGIAFIGTMCRRRSSTGLSQDGGRSITSLATTVAHELGHIFNMNHDNGRGCTCNGANNKCVMSADSGSPPPTLWSSCSIDDLNVLISRGDDSCLFNTPTEVVGDPVCGNSIREGSEVCDCGSPQECTDSCCDAATCQLVPGAVCSAGACCTSQCQFRTYGTQCRSAANECDVVEYCLGGSSECPQDDRVVDGTACGSGSNTGYCNDGRCPSHNAQCLAAWGTSTGPTACYNFNTYGHLGGNCGHAATQYLPCTSANVMCGQLQCWEGAYTHLYGSAGVLFTLTTGSGRCNSYGVQLSFDGMNPGLVEEGTKCGDGMVCDLQRCVSLSSQSIPTCPSAGGEQCSGPTRGVCNNRGMCSCNVGFTGSACQNNRSTAMTENL